MKQTNTSRLKKCYRAKLVKTQLKRHSKQFHDNCKSERRKKTLCLRDSRRHHRKQGQRVQIQSKANTLHKQRKTAGYCFRVKQNSVCKQLKNGQQNKPKKAQTQTKNNSNTNKRRGGHNTRSRLRHCWFDRHSSGRVLRCKGRRKANKYLANKTNSENNWL